MIAIHNSVAEASQNISHVLPDEMSLINGLRSGCPDTFRIFYKMYAAALLGVITRIVKSDEIAEDLLQETFIKIWNSIDRYEVSKGRLFTWLISVAKNLAIDYLRSKVNLQDAKRTPIDDISPEQFSHHQASINPDTIGLKHLAAQLKAGEKEVLDLIYFQGYTHMEVAETLNLPLGTVKTKLRRAIQNLRNCFGEGKDNEVRFA